MKPTLLTYYYHPDDHKLRQIKLQHGPLLREKRFFGDASIVIVHADTDSIDRHRARTPEPTTHLNVTVDSVRTLYGKACGTYSRHGSFRVKCCADDLNAMLLVHASVAGAANYAVSSIDGVD